VLTDILAGASLVTTAVTGKGTTEIALDILTGKDCRLIEGALREDRDFCEEEGSPATEDDFKGLAGWVDDNALESPVPGDQQNAEIMVAEFNPPQSAAAIAVASTNYRPAALASLTELPNDWIVLASIEHDTEAAGFATLSPASGVPSLVDLKLGDAPLPFLPNSEDPNQDMADWAVERLPQRPAGVFEKSLIMPDIVFAPFLPAPAKPVIPALPPNPEKPALQAKNENLQKAAHAKNNFVPTAG